MAALRTRDGACLLGEMGAHTINAGQIYFAAGTPDPSDIFGDEVDLAASVAREMEEETGFTPAQAPPAPGWSVVVSRAEDRLHAGARSRLSPPNKRFRAWTPISRPIRTRNCCACTLCATSRT